jgi:hypothetical protein
MEGEAPEATLTDLPVVVQQEVLRLAGLDATVAAALSCRSLHAAAAHPPLWQAFFAERLRPLRGVHDVLGEAATPRVGWQRFAQQRWASGTPARTLACGAGASSRGVTALAFTAGGTLHASYEGGALVEWDASVGGSLRRVDAPHGQAGLNALAACGPATVATGGVDNAVRLWDVRASPAAPVLLLPDAHAGEVLSLASLGGDAAPLLASGGGDEQVRVWDARFAADALLELTGCSGSVFSLAHDVDAQRLYAGARRDICLFSLLDGAWLATLQGHSHDVYGLAIGGQRLLSCGDDGRVCAWHRQPPSADATEADGAEIEEEQEPIGELLVRKLDARQGDLGDVTSVTCLVGLGRMPSAFLAGSWEGDVVLGEFEGAARTRRFGAPLPRGGGDDAQQRFDAVTAMAARDAVVAVGHNSGALRLMLLDDSEDDAA